LNVNNNTNDNIQSNTQINKNTSINNEKSNNEVTEGNQEKTESNISSNNEVEKQNIRKNNIEENNNEVDNIEESDSLSGAVDNVNNNNYNYVSGSESDIESSYDSSSEIVPLTVRKMNIKRKLNSTDSSSNNEYDHKKKRFENNENNENGEIHFTEIWDNLPIIDADDLYIPKTIHEALNSKYKNYWTLAINEELENYDIHKTATKISLNQVDKNRKLIKLKWIFSVKTNEDNKVKKFKARLVAKGYTQKKNVDYFTTYSPTLAYESLRYLIAYAARHSYNCYQLDIKGAYLNSKIDINLYTEIPMLHPDYEDGYCWKLNKALYGLKQAGKLWYEEINDSLINKLGFTRTYADTNIYYKTIGNNDMLIIGLYVDDMVIIGTDKSIQDIISKIKELYTISKVEEINSILGIKITRTSEDEYIMDQSKYIQNKLNEYHITDEKDNPYSEISDSEKNKIDINPTKYRSAIGSLIHLARCTRPDISETISKLSTKRNNPTMKDWKMLLNVLKYLKKTKNYYLKFNSKGDILGYSDASFGPKDENDDAKSTTGYIIYFGSAPICWKSKKQKFTARSTTEAEFNATADLIEKVIWLNNLNKEIEGRVLLFHIYSDNISNIKILTNEKRTNSSRHFDIDYSFVMDYIKEDFINISYINSNNMLADILTKKITKDSFNYFIDNTFYY